MTIGRKGFIVTVKIFDTVLRTDPPCFFLDCQLITVPLLCLIDCYIFNSEALRLWDSVTVLPRVLFHPVELSHTVLLSHPVYYLTS